ncbi:MAG: KpsF/GutQ family sugar-phosphate isomerase [Rubricella sp.]
MKTSSPTETAGRRLAAGRRVLELEGAALTGFAETLDGAFADAVDLLLRTKGRIVVSGMGKSGHVGRKIAATFASTGAPAQFVHPAEASHGDLGMVTAEDTLLVLSNSGETPELSDIIAHAKRFAIPLIGVASRPGSTLLRQADVALVLPSAGEACPNGLAPTTSTTLTLALGDALAVALMEERSFGAEHFRQFHPGGKLGARLATVRDLMHGGDALPLVGLSVPMTEALIVMSQRGFGVVGVTDAEGRLAGIITDGDLRRHMDGLLERDAQAVMTRRPRTIGADALAEEALRIMNEKRITTLFVLDREDRPEGLINVHDCLRAGVG